MEEDSKNCLKKFMRYLRLREHVKTPWAHFTISWHTDQIMGILSSHHIYTVHRMLQKDRK